MVLALLPESGWPVRDLCLRCLTEQNICEADICSRQSLSIEIRDENIGTQNTEAVERLNFTEERLVGVASEDHTLVR